VVIRTQDFGWEVLGHIPDAPTPAELKGLQGKTGDDATTKRVQIKEQRDAIDCGECATGIARRQLVIRLHPAFPGRAELRALPAPQLREALVEKDKIESDWKTARFDRHPYPGEKEESSEPSNEVIVFARLIEPKKKLGLTQGRRATEQNIAELKTKLGMPLAEEGESDSLSETDYRVSLDEHSEHVMEKVDASVAKLEPESGKRLFHSAADLHDRGKADSRFQAMLASITPYEAMERPVLLAKSGSRRLTGEERNLIAERAQYPGGFRHEMLSTQIVQHRYAELVNDAMIDRELLLHLVAAHHGHARPFAPVTTDEPQSEELLGVKVRLLEIPPTVRKQWVPLHRLDSGVAERFWTLTRRHGWWGLAYLESILRLADQQASAAEQDKKEGAT
jgi:CRISPR-associated endonuclease/helicase Cas3